MKKRYLLLLMILISIPSALGAVSVTLGTPEITDNIVTFTCSAESTEGDLTSIKLYHDAIDWHTNQTNDTSSESTNDTTSSFTVTNLPIGTFQWNCQASNGTSSEDKFATSNSTFQVTSEAEGGGGEEGGESAGGCIPLTQDIPDINWSEDTTLSGTIDLDDYFSGTSITYTVNGNSNINITIAGNGQLTLSSSGNWSGTETVTFNATNGTCTNQSNSVLLNVSAVNDAPYLISPIPEQNWSINTNKTISLLDYFEDVESTLLIFSVTNVSNITMIITGEEVKFTPDPNWTGTRTVVFTANDTEASTQSNSVTLRVLEGNVSTNNKPTISTSSPSSTSTTMKSTQAKTFSIIAKDLDNDTLTYKWYLNGNEVSGATTSAYTLSTQPVGDTTLKVEVSDGKTTTTKTWNVKVISSLEEAPETGDLGGTTTSPTINKTTIDDSKESFCGDGTADLDENCLDCPEDVQCANGEVCQNKICIKKASNKTALIVFAVITLIIGGAGFWIYKASTSKPEGSTTKRNIRVGTGYRTAGKEQPAAEVRDFYKRQPQARPSMKVSTRYTRAQPKKASPPQTKPEIKKEPPKVQPKKEIKVPPAKETPLQSYVRKMRTKGYDDKYIQSKLKSKGWTDKQIKGAM